MTHSRRPEDRAGSGDRPDDELLTRVRRAEAMMTLLDERSARLRAMFVGCSCALGLVLTAGAVALIVSGIVGLRGPDQTR